MRPIPPKMREEMSDDPYYSRCARQSNECMGFIEWHHAMIYARRQVNKKWAIVPLCHEHHEGKYKNDEYARHIALQRATACDLMKYPRANWEQEKKYLKKKYEDLDNN